MIRIIEYGALTATRGGIESYIRNQVACLSEGKNKKEIQFDFLVPNEDEKLAYEDELNVYGCKFYRAYRRWKNSFFGHYIDLYHFFKDHSKDYDIAVANYLDLQNINFLIVAKLFGLKTVAHAHNAYVPRNLKYKILVFLNRILGLFFIDGLFACSPSAAKWMFGNLLMTVKKNKYFQINNRINLKIFRFSPDKRKKMRASLNLNENTLVIGNSGRMVNQKNQLFLIDVFYEYLKLNKDALLIILGDGILKSVIIQKINLYGIEGHVILPGNVSNVADWLQAIDFFVFPSIYEGLGMSVIESQAAGLQTFISDRVPPDANISDICHCISLDKPAKFWANEIDKYKNYIRKDMYNIIEKAGYNSNICKDEYLEIYKRILD